MARPKSDIDKRIVRAARRRFLAKGVDGASLRDIARSAGTSIGMIYYYFPTKDDLFYAVVDEVYGALLADLAAALSPVAGAGVAPPDAMKARLARLSLRISQMTPTELDVIRLVIRELLTSSRRLENLVSRFRRGHIALMMDAVGEGVASGAIDGRIHPMVLAMTSWTVAAVPQIILRFAGNQLPFSNAPPPAELAATLVDILFHGVARTEPKKGSR